MARELNVPWNQIRDEFCQGASAKTLATKFGLKPDTITVRASRQGWQSLNVKQRAEVEKKTQAIVEKHVAKSLPIIEASVQAWIAKSKDVAGKLVNKVSAKIEEAETPDALLKLASTLEKADNVGRQALGMNVTTPGTQIHVAFGLQILGKDGPTLDT